MFSLENGNLHPHSCPNTNAKSTEKSSTAAVLLWSVKGRSHCQADCTGCYYECCSASISHAFSFSVCLTYFLLPAFCVTWYYYSFRNKFIEFLACNYLLSQLKDHKSTMWLEKLLPSPELASLHSPHVKQYTAQYIVSCLIIQISNKQGTKRHLVSSVKDK